MNHRRSAPRHPLDSRDNAPTDGALINRSLDAIQTKHKGYLFRSRTEARWSVVWDSLGIEWQYEVEGYRITATRTDSYLPDFYFPRYQWFAEIKPLVPSDGTIIKLNAFGDLIKFRGARGLLIIVGQPGEIDETTSD